ncbi:MAG: putative amidohydrolase [Oceanospirillaceae bacterium]|jgi:predicted amidohydrolase
MAEFKIGVAQISSVQGSINVNVQRHISVIKRAAEQGVTVLVFPELSLTGYELALAKELALTIDDARLEPLRALAVELNMHIVVGAPIKNSSVAVGNDLTSNSDSIYLGAIIFEATGGVSLYTKMHLHSTEQLYFKAGNSYTMLEIQGHRIAMAICADTNAPSHIQESVDDNATIYVAGVLFTPSGYLADTQKLADFAQQHNILVTMANYNRISGGLLAIGKSAAWGPKGLLACANERQDCLVISQQVSNNWVSQIIECNA